jgi:hypothetical protein
MLGDEEAKSLRKRHAGRGKGWCVCPNLYDRFDLFSCDPLGSFIHW